MSAGDEFPALPKAPYPDDRRRRADVESLGGLPSRQPAHGRVDDASAKIRTVCPSHSGLLVRAGEEDRNDQEEQPLLVEFVFSKNALIAELIRRQFGKTLSLSAVSRVMKLLGFTAQKPLYRAWQQDAA
ncbi:helix-turn-helix domain-containing protein, partial [Azotobacter chroococcum]|uniref:helix-turn-helix domain-containing protein n=1 Tax=Azotobacter chroococcum TaxID=353 RepID=UPI00325BAB16